MADNSQLPFLIRLVDDRSPVVRAKVARELVAFGPRLEQELDELGLSLSPEQKLLVDEIIGQAPLVDDEWLRRLWPSWLQQEDDTARLEEALDLLARWHRATESSAEGDSSGRGDSGGRGGDSNARTTSTPLAVLLDAMADDFLRSNRETTPQQLSAWLFTRAGRNLRGASPEGGYQPQHSNMAWVLQHKRGLPISLACVFILVGHRLGLDISGCNFPGHFLARARAESDANRGAGRLFDLGFNRRNPRDEEQRDLFFDCYNGGRLLSDEESAALLQAAPHAMTAKAPAVAIVARVLRNLIVAFEQNGALDHARLMVSLLSDLERSTEES